MEKVFFFLILISFLVACSSDSDYPTFQSDIPEKNERMWVGPEYWANRLQDWRIVNGQIECVETRSNKPMRTLHLLPYSLGDKRGDLQMSVHTGLLEGSDTLSENTWTGFLIGAGGGKIDHRGAALVHHDPGKGGGIIAGISGTGELFFRDMSKNGYPLLPFETISTQKIPLNKKSELKLILEINAENNQPELSFSNEKGSSTKIRLKGVDPTQLSGNVALVSHPGDKSDKASYWFRDWKVSGSRLVKNKSAAFGPILATYYTVHNGTMKMTAQFPPFGKNEAKTALLETWDETNKQWKKASEATIESPSFTALFRMEGLNGTEDIPYRVSYKGLLHGTKQETSFFEGTIAHDPKEKESITVAAFTGNQNIAHQASGQRNKDAGRNSFDVGTTAEGSRWTANNVWFPHEDMTANLSIQEPDLLVFTGDQVYESNPSSAAFNDPYPDYLYKWYLWCWAYRDLTRNIPTVCMPDDHDVYQGNIWGWGGRRTAGEYPSEGKWDPRYNNGGYWMPADWVKMVERTQTAHLPDPFDPTPVEQGIGVYYTALNWGGIGFAILEDRKFKIPPPSYRANIDKKVDSLKTIYGSDFTPRIKDIPEGKILGERQLDFIRSWNKDWKGVFMKASLTQTIFASAHTAGNLLPGKPSRDVDANGWPAPGRNQALEELRKSFTFMIGGDQHLATVIHHGIDEFNDAGYSFCVPSVANYWTRSWIPDTPGGNHNPGMPDYTGEYLDGWGNKINVLAAANPKSPQALSEAEKVRKRTELHRKNPGYGIVHFNKQDRSITMECWPRYVNPEDPATGEQHRGWPVVIHQEDNYDRKALAYLPELKFQGLETPLVQIFDQTSGELIYAIRAKGKTFRPKVFAKRAYKIVITDPDTGKSKTLEKVNSISEAKDDSIMVDL